MTFLTHIWLATSMLTSRKKSSDARAVLSRPVERALHRLGQDISAARRMRRLSQEDLAQRIGTSLSTVRRMEDGYPGTALHTFLGALQILGRSEDHTSELQSLMRISSAVFCLQKKITYTTVNTTQPHSYDIYY